MKFENLLNPHWDQYDEETKTFQLKRDGGLFALLNDAILKTILLELNNFKVERIKIVGGTYIRNFDLFPELFETKEQEINFSHLSDETKENFLKNCNTSFTGISNNPKSLDFNITNQIISKFFNPSEHVVDWYRKFLLYLNVDLKNLIFIWARKTDKVSETSVPDVWEYKKILDRVDKKNKKILLQTDDITVLNEFKNSQIQFITLPHIKTNTDGKRPFHVNLCDIPDKEFEKENGITKIEHLRQMVALSLISKNAGLSILYPGNPTTFIPLLKGSTDNCLLFKNGYNLF
jgi:hypothetical protein